MVDNIQNGMFFNISIFNLQESAGTGDMQYEDLTQVGYGPAGYGPSGITNLEGGEQIANTSLVQIQKQYRRYVFILTYF